MSEKKKVIERKSEREREKEIERKGETMCVRKKGERKKLCMYQREREK